MQYLGCFNFHTACEDLANQIRWSREYQKSCSEAGVEPVGKFLSPEAGEWFSGLPRYWTSTQRGKVNVEEFDKTFPWARREAGG